MLSHWLTSIHPGTGAIQAQPPKIEGLHCDPIETLAELSDQLYFYLLGFLGQWRAGSSYTQSIKVPALEL